MKQNKTETVKENKGSNFIDVDKVFRNKGGKLYPVIPKILVRYLEHIVHQDDINDVLTRLRDLKGIDFLNELIENEFGIDVQVVNSENISKKGRYVVASNHPLGGLDGIALMYAIGKIRADLKFLANDILLEIENLKELFVPVDMHGQKGYEAVKTIESVYESDQLVLIFPAGLVSRRKKGIIKDLEWKKSFITKAIRHKRDIIPVHINGKNSNFFYNLANFRKRLNIKLNLEMLYLPDEMFKQQDKSITITFGKPISHKLFTKEKTHMQWAQKVKEHVYGLPKNKSLFKI